MTTVPSLLGEIDLHLISEGRHEQLWDVLGAHVRTSNGVTGTSFAVWAPRAREIRLAGDFNYWSGQDHQMRPVGSSGVWELFVPGVGDGTRYKFLVHGADGSWKLRADPLAFRAETPPATASGHCPDPADRTGDPAGPLCRTTAQDVSRNRETGPAHDNG